jgi:hypothetical protein
MLKTVDQPGYVSACHSAEHVPQAHKNDDRYDNADCVVLGRGALEEMVPDLLPYLISAYAPRNHAHEADHENNHLTFSLWGDLTSFAPAVA